MPFMMMRSINIIVNGSVSNLLIYIFHPKKLALSIKVGNITNLLIFGGDANFEKRQELDEKKRNLCKHNNVRLVEWPHTLEVTVQNFSEMLKG